MKRIKGLFVLLSFILTAVLQGYYINAADKVFYPNGLDNVKRTIHAGTDDDPIKITGQDGLEHIIDGSGMAVAVIDDAIGRDHPGFENKPKNPKRGKEKLILLPDYTRDYSEDLTLPWDLWHGLHVAGIIAGNGRSSEEKDAPQYKGIAPEAQIIFAKTKDSNKKIVGDTDMAQAIEDAVLNGADVINMSLGTESSTYNSSRVLRDAIDRAVANGVVVVATTGNSGYMGYPDLKPKAVNPDYGVIASPGLFSNVLSTMSFDVENINNRYILADNNPRKLRVKDRQYNNVNYSSIQDQEKAYVYIKSPDRYYFHADDFSDVDVRDKFVILDKYGPEYAVTKYGDIYPGYTGAAVILKEKGAAGVILVEPQGFNYHPLEEIQVWDSYAKTYVAAGREVYEEVADFPILGLTYEDGHSLIEQQNGTMTLFSAFADIPIDTGNKVTDFSSWGVSSDLVFKPDLGASAGIGVWSFSNYTDVDGRRHYSSITKRGTSMAAPQVSAAAALVKQRLKLQYPDLINRNVVSLIQNLLVSTAKPMKDDDGIYFSPRGQGNGLLQIKEACLSDVITKSDLNIADIESGYAKTNLRTIGNKVEFSVYLENYGLKEHRFKAPEITVLTDKIKDGYFTMRSKIIDNTRIKLTSSATNDIVVPARIGNTPGKTVVKIAFDLSDIDAELLQNAPKGYWIDGIIKFKGDVDIYHSFTGFKGDWQALDVYEKFVYDFNNGGEKEGITIAEQPFYNLKKYNGLHVTAFLTQMGYNRRNYAIKKVLGELPDSKSDNIRASRYKLAISPNDDAYADYIEPRFIMLRNFASIKFNIKDSLGNNVFDREYGTGNTDNGKNFSSEEKPFTENTSALRWDGKVDEEVKEGLYKITVRVYKDIVNYVNPVTDTGTDANNYQEDHFDLKVDITPPILKPVKIVSKENGNVIFRINAEDKKLKNTDIDGSGIYKAVLITTAGEEELKFNPENEIAIKDYEKILPQTQFETAKIRLTDWAGNTSIYNLDSIIDGQDSGNINIKSVVKSEDGEDGEIDVSYVFENVITGKIYSFYEHLPVGEYLITPYNIPKGYIFADNDQKQEVIIEKDKTLEKVFEYEKSGRIAKIVVSEAIDRRSSKIAADNNINIRLINVQSGILYIAKLEGREYNFNVPFGVYKIEFTNLKDNLQARIFDQENVETKYIKAEGISGVYYKYGFNEENPGAEIKITPEIAEHYYEGKTYMLVSAENNKNITIHAYPTYLDDYGEVELDESQPLIINDHNATITEVPSLENPKNKIYHIELNNEVIEKLIPGMVLKVKAVDKDDATDITESSRLAVVSYNEVLNAQKMEYMKLKTAEALKNNKITEEVKNEIYEKIADIEYDMHLFHNSIDRTRAINWSYRGYTEDYAIAGLIQAHNKMNEFRGYMNEKLKEDITYPLIYIHGAYLPNVKNILFRVYGDENEYVGVEDFTTSIVADENAVLNAAKFLKKEALADPETEEDISFENLNKLSMLPITKSFKIFNSWNAKNVKLSNNSENDAELLFDTISDRTVDILLVADINDYGKEKSQLFTLGQLIEKAEKLYNLHKNDKNNTEAEMFKTRIDKLKKFLNDPILSMNIINKEYEKLTRAVKRFEDILGVKSDIEDDKSSTVDKYHRITYITIADQSDKGVVEDKIGDKQINNKKQPKISAIANFNTKHNSKTADNEEKYQKTSDIDAENKQNQISDKEEVNSTKIDNKTESVASVADNKKSDENEELISHAQNNALRNLVVLAVTAVLSALIVVIILFKMRKKLTK